MIHPIGNPLFPQPQPAPKKKALKEVDARVKKATKQTKMGVRGKGRAVQASNKLASAQAISEAQKASRLAKQRAIQTRKASVEAHKAAALARQLHLAQQAAAVRKALAAEKAKKEASKAAKKEKEARHRFRLQAAFERIKKRREESKSKKRSSSTKKKKKKHEQD